MISARGSGQWSGSKGWRWAGGEETGSRLPALRGGPALGSSGVQGGARAPTL